MLQHNAFILPQTWTHTNNNNNTITTLAARPLHTVQVTILGHVYHLHDITTLADLHDRLWDESGLSREDQGTASLQGRLLEDESTCLSDCMEDGDQINMIPQPIADRFKLMHDMGHGLASLQNRIHLQGPFADPTEASDLHVMTDLYHNLSKMPFFQEELERFLNMLQHPDTIQRAKDPDKIESLRQVLLNNPMFLDYLQKTPKAYQAVQDEQSWYQYMCDTMEEWKTLSVYDLWQRLIEGRLFGTE